MLCFVAVQGCICLGLDLRLLPVFEFQQDNSGLSMLKMRDAVGLKELNLQEAEILGIWSGGLFRAPV